MEALAEKYVTVKKEVVEVMGGKVLDYEAKDILLRGRAEGRVEGRAEGMAYTVEKLLEKGYSAEEISNMLDMELEEIKSIEEKAFSLS